MGVVHVHKEPLPGQKHRCSENFSLASHYPVGSNSLLWEVTHCEARTVVFDVRAVLLDLVVSPFSFSLSM